MPTCSSPVRHVSLRRDPVRLACIRHAASVDPEPGSNSPPSVLPSMPQRINLSRSALHAKRSFDSLFCVLSCGRSKTSPALSPKPAQLRSTPSSAHKSTPSSPGRVSLCFLVLRSAPVRCRRIDPLVKGQRMITILYPGVKANPHNYADSFQMRSRTNRTTEHAALHPAYLRTNRRAGCTKRTAFGRCAGIGFEHGI